MKILKFKLKKEGYPKQVDKPNSVFRRAGMAIIYLMRPTRESLPPGGTRSEPLRFLSKILLYLALLRVGFIRPGRCRHSKECLFSKAGRWALTPPFHPYPGKPGRYGFCDTFRLAGLASGKPRILSGRPALWSSDFPPRAHRPRRSPDLFRIPRCIVIVGSV